jgi:hypothetical protein
MRRADIEVPNLPAAVDARGRSACYPRGNFYPLIDGPSTQNHRFTRPGFRPCSACRPHSQAPFYPCALQRISVPPEGTFGRLRYPLGGDRPSQTARQALSPNQGLGPQPHQGGISPAPPPPPKGRLHRLPPILRRRNQEPTPGCSKAPRGLFVLPRVGRIFTASSISPGPSPRQRSGRYAFRAGRNLPDKEFRYLRTVIVTAAVHRGFGSGLAPLPLTFRHRASVAPYTSSYEFAESCVFGKQSPEPVHCGSLIASTPSPEVTGLTCRVPWRGFSRAP